jgi:hypothetical protein
MIPARNIGAKGKVVRVDRWSRAVYLVLMANAGVQDLQGSEFYYNAEINSWFHLTGDIQVVETEIA